MERPRANFKQIKKKVISYNDNAENIPMNPKQEFTFKGIRRCNNLGALTEMQ